MFVLYFNLKSEEFQAQNKIRNTLIELRTLKLR